jgi:GNAT superfamily N-acetyltransferase
MKDGYYIRFAASDDGPAITQIEIDAGERFAELPDSFQLFETSGARTIGTFDHERLRALTEKQQVWVVCHHDLAVGFAVCSSFSTAAYLEEIDVVPEHGRRGLATALIEHACAWARSKGLTCIELCTFRTVPWNAPFYEKLGFNIVPASDWSEDNINARLEEERQGIPMEDRVVMRRKL